MYGTLKLDIEHKCVVCSRYGAKHYRCINGATYWLCKPCKEKSKYPMDETEGG